MSILSKTSSISRYGIVEQAKPFTLEELRSRLSRTAFQSIDEVAQERSYGWVSFTDYLAAPEPHDMGAYVAFALRLDTRRISPAVLKKEFTLAIRAEQEAIRETGRTFISKDRKAEIRDQVVLKLRLKATPVPAFWPVVWNTKDGEVMLFSVNGKVRNLFGDLFTATFSLTLEPLTPYVMARREANESQHAQIDDLEPSGFAA